MKSSTKAIATAVTLALVSAAAHAQLPAAALGTSNPASATGLILGVWDTSDANSEVVNLGYNYSQMTLASGNLQPTAANAAFSATTAPGGSGNVLQINFGQIPGFTDGLFNSSNLGSVQFGVWGGTIGGPGIEGFVATSPSVPATAYGSVQTIVSGVQAEIANWAALTAPIPGNLEDKTGTTTTAVSNTGALNNGQLSAGQQFSGALNSVVEFYNVTTTAAHKAVISDENGYFYLSSSGDLTYNVPTAGSSGGTSSGGTSSGGTSSGGTPPPVPLPPAVWLFGSALLGFGGIARRRAGV